MNKTFLIILIFIAVIIVGMIAYSAIINNHTSVDVAEPTPAANIERDEGIAEEESIVGVVESVLEEPIAETIVEG